MTHIAQMLGRSVRFENGCAYVALGDDIEAIFDSIILQWIAHLFPTGRFHVHHDGKGRRYLDFQTQTGQPKRFQVSRIILCLLSEPEQKNRQAHHRDRDWLNFLPENLYLGSAAYVRGDDDTWQEVARRLSAREEGREPDRERQILDPGYELPKGWLDAPVTFPPIPVRLRLRERMLNGGRVDA